MVWMLTRKIQNHSFSERGHMKQLYIYVGTMWQTFESLVCGESVPSAGSADAGPLERDIAEKLASGDAGINVWHTACANAISSGKVGRVFLSASILGNHC